MYGRFSLLEWDARPLLVVSDDELLLLDLDAFSLTGAGVAAAAEAAGCGVDVEEVVAGCGVCVADRLGVVGWSFTELGELSMEGGAGFAKLLFVFIMV